MIEIRKVHIEDAEKICEIANSNSQVNIKKKELATGFLVSEFKVSDYERYIEENEHFYVLTDNDEIKGFLLAYKKDELDMSLVVNRKIDAVAQNEYVVIKQICIARSEFRKGYARKLYDFFIEQVKLDIYLAVVLNPYNEASVKFHNNLGFNQVFEVVAEDGKERGIYYKALKFSDIDVNDDIILHQYDVAIDLYKHEDELNWSKMNHLFYVIGGFFILATFMYEKLSGLWLYVGMLAVSSIGILISYLFHITIKSGINYLQKRKNAVIEIEQVLIMKKGVRIVSSKFDNNYNKFKKSETTKIMMIIPKLVIILWVILMVYIIIKVFLDFM